MPFLQTLLVRLCLFSLLFSTIFAAPVDEINNELVTRYNEKELARLLKRDPGDTESDPIDASFDITNWPGIAEENCYAMLCLLNGKRVYQRVATANANRRQYTDSGASLRPFRADQLGTRHTAQISSATTSAEEFPWESMQEGGAGAYVFPATQEEQDRQGGALGTGYESVPYNKFFRVTFQPASSFGTYCTALFSNPPDTSVCANNDLKQTLFNVANVILANFAYTVVKQTKPYYFIHGAGSQKGTKRSEDAVLKTLPVEADA